MLCYRMSAAALLLGVLLLFTGCCSPHSACNPLAPRAITHSGYRVAPELLALRATPIERGRQVRCIDAVGWVLGIPGRVLLWDPRIDNHRISHHTEAVLASYLHDNDLHHVKARLNQYAPLEDWRRLRANKTVGCGYRYTLGTLSVLGEAIFPGRIFGGDHYNPFTATIHLYSDVPSIALHEAAHAKDFSRRTYPGTYALAYLVPGVPLWHERVATSDVLSYTETSGDDNLRREAYRLLYPAYGTYVGSALGFALPRYADPVYYGSVLIGHAVAHEHAYAIEEPPLGNLGVGRRWIETAPRLHGPGDEAGAVSGDGPAAATVSIEDGSDAELPLLSPHAWTSAVPPALPSAASTAVPSSADAQ